MRPTIGYISAAIIALTTGAASAQSPQHLPGIVSQHFNVRLATYFSGGTGLTGHCPPDRYDHWGDAYFDSSSANTLDRHWIQGDTSIGVTWDLGSPSRLVVAFGSIDHGPVPIEAYEFALLGSNDLSNWEPAVMTAIVDDGWVDYGTAEESDDWSTVWSFTHEYRYVRAVANYDGDFEMDAVGAASLTTPPSIAMTGPTTCAAIGDLLTFDVVVNNPPLTLVAGQFAINYDKTVLEYVSVEGGDNPITSIPLVLPNPQAGKLFWVSSVQGGGTGTAATSRVARVTFRAIANDCDGNSQISFDPGFAPILTANGDGTGASLPTTDPAPVTIDTIGPVITNVPADLVVAADAGAGCLAVREIGTPTVTDSCSTAALTWSRSDGAALLSAPWLCGTTVVTWTATDACGRTSTATTSVTVNSYHLMNVTVAYAGTGYASSMTRCIGFRVDDVTLTDVMTFMSGTATATLQLPIGDYNCATADDDLHSLVSQVPVSINGTNYQMNVTGDSALINGDLDDDNVVNVVDWGVLVVRVGMAAAVNTDCTTVGFHADFDGDGTVTNADGNRLLQSFLVQGDTGCNAFNANGGPVVTRISVADLSVIAGMNASAADMNRDGVVDAKDIAMWTRLQSMPGRQPLTAKGVSSRN